MAEDRSTKAYKGLSQKETREKLIKDRAARLARDAKKQGITPAALAKKKKDTYIKVVGGAASLLPIGKIISLAGKAIKGGTAAVKAAKAAPKKTTGTAVTKARSTSVATKSKTPAAKAGARAKSQSTAVAIRPSTKVGRAKPTRKMINITPPKGSRTKITTKPPKKSTKPMSKGKAAAIIATTTGLTGAALLGSKGQKKAGASVTAPTSRPKRTTKRTGMSEGNTVAGSSGRKPSRNAPNFGLGKMRKTEGSSGKPQARRKALDKMKGPLASARKEYPVTGPKKKTETKPVIPAGAKPFRGSYNKKTEKLKNIGGKTYVLKR